MNEENKANCSHNNYSQSYDECNMPGHGENCSVAKCDNCNQEISHDYGSSNSHNIGQQFTSMIGYSLITDSINSLVKMQELTRPHADKVFGDSMRSDRDTLDHPAVKAHNSLSHAEFQMHQALDSHEAGNKVAVIHHAINSHKYLVKALESGLHIPEIREGNGDFIGHASDLTQNMIKLNKLYGEG
jgi:hypothetical protein